MLVLACIFLGWPVYPFCVSPVILGLAVQPLRVAIQAINEMTEDTSKLTVTIDE